MDRMRDIVGAHAAFGDDNQFGPGEIGRPRLGSGELAVRAEVVRFEWLRRQN